MKQIMPRVISASLSPNTETDDVLRAAAIFLAPWRWKTGRSLGAAALWFTRRFGGRDAVFFNSGRSALLAILKSFSIGKNDEVIVQAFTCVAVPNSVLWAGATPIYADIDASYNLDAKDVAKKITPRTKAVIVQHTFGTPANLGALKTLAEKHNIVIIEDCAHAMGSSLGGSPLGITGDAAFFSFGRDKSVSSVWGGAAMIAAKYPKEIVRLHDYQAALPYPGMLWIIQQIFHPIAFAVILPLYRWGMGKILLVMLQKLNMLSFPVFAIEKRGGKPGLFPAKYPNALAYLLVGQLAKVDRFTAQRSATAKLYAAQLKGPVASLPVYSHGSSYLRYTVAVQNPEHIRQLAKQQGMLLGNWYNNIIDPAGVDFAAVGYKKGSCKNAERMAHSALNLPTRISRREAGRIISFLNSEV